MDTTPLSEDHHQVEAPPPDFSFRYRWRPEFVRAFEATREAYWRVFPGVTFPWSQGDTIPTKLGDTTHLVFRHQKDPEYKSLIWKRIRDTQSRIEFIWWYDNMTPILTGAYLMAYIPSKRKKRTKNKAKK